MVLHSQFKHEKGSYEQKRVAILYLGFSHFHFTQVHLFPALFTLFVAATAAMFLARSCVPILVIGEAFIFVQFFFPGGCIHHIRIRYLFNGPQLSICSTCLLLSLRIGVFLKRVA